MLWFKKKCVKTSMDKELLAHKQTVKKAAQEANKASGKVKDIIDKNGFTIIIAVAMGANHGRVKTHGH